MPLQSSVDRQPREELGLETAKSGLSPGSLSARLLHSGVSAVEHRPADVVSQPLIIQDQFADRVRELFSLPSTLEPPSVLTLAFRSGCTRRLDRVGRRTELVRSDVRYRRGLAGGIGGMAGGPA